MIPSVWCPNVRNQPTWFSIPWNSVFSILTFPYYPGLRYSRVFPSTSSAIPSLHRPNPYACADNMASIKWTSRNTAGVQLYLATLSQTTNAHYLTNRPGICRSIPDKYLSKIEIDWSRICSVLSRSHAIWYKKVSAPDVLLGTKISILTKGWTGATIGATCVVRIPSSPFSSDSWRQTKYYLSRSVKQHDKGKRMSNK